MPFETQSSVPRTKDTTGELQDIKVFSQNADGSGEQIQAVALTGIDGAKAGVPGLPVHVQGAVLDAIETALATLATEVKLEAVRALLASLDGKDFATAANQLPDGHNVTVDNVSIPVTGTFWQATQPTKEQVGLVIDEHDYIDCGYDGSGNLTSAVYKTGGAGGATVATLALTYDGSGNLDTVTKT